MLVDVVVVVVVVSFVEALPAIADAEKIPSAASAPSVSMMRVRFTCPPLLPARSVSVAIGTDLGRPRSSDEGARQDFASCLQLCDRRAPSTFGFHDTQAAANKESGGPFPGDEALFSFILSDNSTLKPQSGSAIYTCQYNFFKNAFCDATFQLKNGTLLGAGALNFNSQTFAMTITGGTGAYRGLSGDVQATPNGTHAQHLVFRLS